MRSQVLHTLCLESLYSLPYTDSRLPEGPTDWCSDRCWSPQVSAPCSFTAPKAQGANLYTTSPSCRRCFSSPSRTFVYFDPGFAAPSGPSSHSLPWCWPCYFLCGPVLPMYSPHYPFWRSSAAMCSLIGAERSACAGGEGRFLRWPLVWCFTWRAAQAGRSVILPPFCKDMRPGTSSRPRRCGRTSRRPRRQESERVR